MAKRTGKRSCKFIGAYVERATKQKLEREAARLDRPVSWVIEKILAEGVKHLTAEGVQEPQALAA